MEGSDKYCPSTIHFVFSWSFFISVLGKWEDVGPVICWMYDLCWVRMENLVFPPSPGDIHDFWTRVLIYFHFWKKPCTEVRINISFFSLHTHIISWRNVQYFTFFFNFPPPLLHALILNTLHTISIAQKQGSHSNSHVQYSLFQTYFRDVLSYTNSKCKICWPFLIIPTMTIHVLLQDLASLFFISLPLESSCSLIILWGFSITLVTKTIKFCTYQFQKVSFSKTRSYFASANRWMLPKDISRLHCDVLNSTHISPPILE